MTDNNNTPEITETAANETDANEVITDEAELARYLAEQELLRATYEANGEEIGDAEELLLKTADITAEQMLSADNSDLTPEQIAMKTEWRDAIIVQVIAEGVKKNFRQMMRETGNGQIKNNKFNQGYMQALNDLYIKLMNIVPEEYKRFTENANKEADNEHTDITPDADQGAGVAGESGTDGEAGRNVSAGSE